MEYNEAGSKKASRSIHQSLQAIRMVNERHTAEASIAISMIKPALMIMSPVCVALILESVSLPKLRLGTVILSSHISHQFPQDDSEAMVSSASKQRGASCAAVSSRLNTYSTY